mmetsp:Transcript_122982/g.244717  ORF Transcript_122982/g.244717 Transcript_122982/m.244717 type:complete len:884 (+) Transcript_122982:125-2776(+)
MDLGQYPSWEFLDCDGEVPQSRSGHTCALYQNRYLYIFGGFDGSNCFDDLYMLDLDTKDWRRIEAKGDRPSGRASHSAVTDDLAGVMYIFGGSGSHFGYTNKRDLCEFCFETETWRLLSNPLEDMPSARYGQSMVAYKEGLYVWGGTHGTNYPTDMHRFELLSKQWSYVHTSGELPCGRYRHQAMVQDDLMYIVGGSGINRYGDVFTFNFGTSVWRKLHCTGTDLSDGRYAHSAVLLEGYIYLYGGNDGVRHDDLQQLDLETRVWSRVVVHGHCPPGRDFHAAVLRKDSMAIFGGSNGMRRHNDVFEFHMRPKVPPCSLSSDLEVLLEQAQSDETVQCSCDVFLAADGGQTAEGVYCHSHLLYVRCSRLHELLQNQVSAAGGGTRSMTGATLRVERCGTAPATSAANTPTTLVAGTETTLRPHASTVPLEAAGKEQDETVDSLLKAVVSDGGGNAENDRVATGRSRVPLDMPAIILWYFVRFLYVESTKFGQLSAEQLYRLFLAAKEFDVPRLAVLCERQIKVRLGLENVLPLLRASTQEGPVAQPIQNACKDYFLANYNQCTELRECEALDPKLLCELMRLHNSRASTIVPSGSVGSTAAPPHQPQQPPPPRGGLVGAPGSPHMMPAAGILAPLSPQAAGRAAAEEQANRAAAIASPTSVAQPTTLNLRDPVSFVPSRDGQLASDLEKLLLEEVSPDFEVVVQDEVIRTHKFILVARSRYFASCILTSGMVEAQAGRLVIPSTSAMTADAFRAFLRFVYAGDSILDILAPHTAMYLVDASSFYGLTNSRLKLFCELCVKDSFNETHVLQLFEASSRLNVEGVRAMALEFIVSHFQTVCQQATLEQLDKPLLIDILKAVADRVGQAMTAGGHGGGNNMPPSLG